MGGFNIGTVKPRIWFLTRGPFYGQPKEEVSYYFDQHTSHWVMSSNIEALPDPIKGVRLAEKLLNYDNFLYSDKYLEDAIYKQDPAAGGQTDYDEGSGEEVDTDTPTTQTQTAQGASKERAAQAVTASGTSGGVSSGQKTFFTWNVSSNIFGEVIGKLFDDAAKLHFAYGLRSRPNDASKSTYLTPFFTRNPETPQDGQQVHWGAKTQCSLPLNQPFEVTYYFNERSFNAPSEGYGQAPKFNGLNIINLGSTGYFALEFGIGTKGHYLLMMCRDDVPRLYLVDGSGCIFVAKYDHPGILQRVFDNNSKDVSIKLECVMGSFIISSNIFPGPWVVQGLPTSTRKALTSSEKSACPIKFTHRIGRGPLGVYGGNIQAGWAFRPVQYACNKYASSNSNSMSFWDLASATLGMSIGDIGGDQGPTGGFKTPKATFSTVSGNSPRVEASLCLKGAGDNVTGRSAGNILMAEAEHISGAESGGRYYNSEDVPSGLYRSIKVSVKKERATSGVVGSGLYDVWANVSMTPSDVSAYGFNIECGRSPYLWMLRLEMPTVKGTEGILQYNVTVDTLAVSLAYNSNNYNEITQTGTLKILNPMVINKIRGTRQCANGIRDYQQFMNRTIYVKIGCHWEGGHGLSGNDDWLFEGMTVGSDVTIEAGRQILTFKLSDYMNVLDQSKFELSPYYDGMVARLAVADIVEQTGLSKSRMYWNDKNIMVSSRSKDDYVLPFLNPLNEPQFKFADGSSFKEAILRIAKYDFKTIYWDRYGNFHYDDGPDILGGGAVPKSTRQFYTSPIATKDASLVAWNSATVGRSVNDVYNVLRVDSIDRNINIRVSANARYSAGITNPAAVGYLGFRKMLLVRDPALGALSAVKRYVNNFQKYFYIPPRTIKFETFGRYDIRPLNIVTLDSQLVRVLNITYELEAATNKFWMTIDGEWFDSISQGSVGGGDPGYTPSPPRPGLF